MHYPLEFVQPPSFGRHEKFAFRYNWPKKGVDAVHDDPEIFAKDDALVVLGVGKNMVRSIRHWGLALGVLEEGNQSGHKKLISVSRFGLEILSDAAPDPYMEDVGTLWLLHWKLVSNLERALIWHLAFSAFYEVEFTKTQLASFIENYLDRLSIRTTGKMIDREVDVFLRTYVAARRSLRQKDFDEGKECPLTELGLLRFLPQDNVYQFAIGAKPSLPLSVFGYALFEYLARIAANRPTVGFAEITYGHGSPGQAFKLDENSTIACLEEIAAASPNLIQLTETAGLRQVYVSDALRTRFGQEAAEILRD